MQQSIEPRQHIHQKHQFAKSVNLDDLFTCFSMCCISTPADIGIDFDILFCVIHSYL